VGAASLIKQVNPDFTPAQIIDILKDSGKQISDGERSYARIDIDDAIRIRIRIRIRIGIRILIRIPTPIRILGLSPGSRPRLAGSHLM